jgi:hypothetical protein
MATRKAAWRMRWVLATISFVLAVATAWAQTAQAPPADPNAASAGSTSSSTANQSNNVLTPLPQILLQNFFMPSVSGFPGRLADEELLRFYWPFMISGVQNMLRIYQPIFVEPLSPSGRNAGLGDTLMFDLVLHDLASQKLGKFTVGAGPLLVMPGRDPQRYERRKMASRRRRECGDG